MTISYQQLIKVIEFWRESIQPEELQDRDIVGAVDLKSREIIDLVGPRRSGKSSILKLIVKRLGLKDNYLFINFADPIFISNNDPAV
ncbi:MAG: AAA family ATPase, partial [Planctomycetes bacterium]|nr:AAA family ATPase [Planctomycetota bacterium]